MTQEIYAWIRNLACFFVIFSGILHLLPDNSYKRYLQYYMGLLLILVLLSPVLRISGIQNKVEVYVKEFYEELEKEREQWEEEAKAWEEKIYQGEEVKIPEKSFKGEAVEGEAVP